MSDMIVLLENRQNPDFVNGLTEENISALVALLSEKNNDLRYAAFLCLQARSQTHSDVYPYWEGFFSKLHSDNSYQRSLGIMLLAENLLWDKERLFDSLLQDILARCRDEKFITCRQTIQSLLKWVEHKPHLSAPIAAALLEIPVGDQPETQRKLILTDIAEVLLKIQALQPQGAIAAYLSEASEGAILDAKGKKSLKQRMSAL